MMEISPCATCQHKNECPGDSSNLICYPGGYKKAMRRIRKEFAEDRRQFNNEWNAYMKDALEEQQARPLFVLDGESKGVR